MKWTIEPPKDAGFYFFRYYNKFVEELCKDLTIVRLEHDGTIYFLGSDAPTNIGYEHHSLWGDKIEIPEMEWMKNV